MSAGSIRVGAIVVGLLLAVGCKKEQQAAKNAPPPPTTTTSTQPIEIPELAVTPAAVPNYKPVVPPATNPSAKFKLTAQQLEIESRQDLMGAKAKYDGQRIEVTGVVRRINVAFNGASTVGLIGPPTADAAAGTAALAPPPSRPATGPTRSEGVNVGTIYAEPWALFAPDQLVTFVGTGRIQGSAAFLTSAEATQSGPSPVVAVAAKDLAAEFAKDPNATEMRYRRTALAGKILLVSGEVLSVANEKLSGKPSGVYIGVGGAKILCHLEYTEPNQTRLLALRPGEPLKLIGEFSGPAPDDKQAAYLTNCCIISR